MIKEILPYILPSRWARRAGRDIERDDIATVAVSTSVSVSRAVYERLRWARLPIANGADTVAVVRQKIPLSPTVQIP